MGCMSAGRIAQVRKALRIEENIEVTAKDPGRDL
jgi:hypothetical protein